MPTLLSTFNKYLLRMMNKYNVKMLFKCCLRVMYYAQILLTMKTTINLNFIFHKELSYAWSHLVYKKFFLWRYQRHDLLPKTVRGYNYPLFRCLSIPDTFSGESSPSQYCHYSLLTFSSFTNGSYCFQTG